MSRSPVTVRQLIEEAGYRMAGLRDVPVVWRLAVRSERDHPGLLGRASGRVPGPLVHAMTCVTLFGWIKAGMVGFDPAGAALVFLPVSGDPRGRRADLVAVLGGVVLVAGPMWGSALLVGWLTGVGFELVVLAVAVVVVVSYTIWGRPRLKAKRTQERLVASASPGCLVLNVGAYFGRPRVASRLAARFRVGADRHRVTLLAQTTGEARIRLYRLFGFRVVSVEDPAGPGRDARVFLVRYPNSDGPTVAEPPERLWRRSR